MLIIHVDIHIDPSHIDAFKAATLANATASVQEPGIARFDVLQDNDDPTHCHFACDTAPVVCSNGAPPICGNGAPLSGDDLAG